MFEEFFEKEKIEYFATLPLQKDLLFDEEKLIRLCGFTPLSVTAFILPYYRKGDENRNISKYAVSPDYHIYFKELFSRFYNYCEKNYPEQKFKGFSDNSPTREKMLCQRAGLGDIGKQSLLINEKYGTYIFIGEIYSDMEAKAEIKERKNAICSNCGACKKACPVGLDFSKCFSAITQKKHTSDEENRLIAEMPLIWGCDLCQDACPKNANISETPIEFFKKDLIRYLDEEKLDKLLKEDKFKERAFSWRGEEVIRRNILLGKKR